MQKIVLNKFGYFAIVLVFVIGGIFLFNFFLAATWLKDKSATTYEEQPVLYKFVLFPKNQDVPVYSDKALTQKIGTLTEAVVSNGQEIKAGIVAAGLFIAEKYITVYLKTSDLNYLVDDSEAQRMVAKYNNTSQQINDPELMIWNSKQDKNGATTIEYTSRDDKHLRSTTYSYVINEATIASVYPIKADNGIVWAVYFWYDFLFGIFLLSITFFFKKYFLKIKNLKKLKWKTKL